MLSKVGWPLKASLVSLLFLSLHFSIDIVFINACTTILVGKHATTTGSALVTHNNDCTDCDLRLSVVPSFNFAAFQLNSSFPVQPCRFSFPRFIGDARGPAFTLQHTERENISHSHFPYTRTQPLGFIMPPSIECPPSTPHCHRQHTYSYIDGSYGISNEMGLAMGESTCATKLVSYPVPLGDALFDVSELMRFALMFCVTSRCAVQLMGQLAEQYGYYLSSDPVEVGGGMYEEGGEAVTVVDSAGEGWVFHVLADDTGKSAVWAAQRLPNSHVTVVANKFIIRKMDLDDSENYLASENLFKVAERAGLWNVNGTDTEEDFDFTGVFAPDANSVGWDNRRTYWVYNQVAPSKKFEADLVEPFPFSVAVDSLLTVADVQRFARSHFEDSSYDLNKGLASEPYGNPNRYDRKRGVKYNAGYFERAISLHRTTYAFVHEARTTVQNEQLSGVTHFAQHAPHSSLFIPLYSATLKLHSSYSTGTLFKLSRQSAWWPFAVVANYAEKFYKYINGVDVKQRQRSLEKEQRKQLEEVDEQVSKILSSSHSDRHTEARELMTHFTVDNAARQVAGWWEFFEYLLCKFRDGQVMLSFEPPVQVAPLFYPVHWLARVGYFDHGPLDEAPMPLAVPDPPHPQALQQTTVHSDKPTSDTQHAAHTEAAVDIKALQQTNGNRHSQRRKAALSYSSASDLQLFQSMYGRQSDEDDYFDEASLPSSLKVDTHNFAASGDEESPEDESSDQSEAVQTDQHAHEVNPSPVLNWACLLVLLIVSVTVGSLAFCAGMRYQTRQTYQPIVDF